MMPDDLSRSARWGAVLRGVQARLGETFPVDRLSLFLLDHEASFFWTLTDGALASALEIHVPVTEGILGEIWATGQPLVLPFDPYEHPRFGETLRHLERQTGYRSYTYMALPILGDPGGDRHGLLGVVCLINKLKPGTQGRELAERVDLAGFTAADEEAFQQLLPWLVQQLETVPGLD